MDSTPGVAPVEERPEALLDLALSRPADALVTARRILRSPSGPYVASIAHQIRGIVLRDRGDLNGAIRELRLGLARAKESGHRDRESEVRATLGTALAWRGDTRSGLEHLDAAVAGTRGAVAARILLRRATILIRLGRFPQGLEDLNKALPVLRAAGDQVWQARALTWRAGAWLALGSAPRAAADFTVAEDLFARTGQEFEYAMARHNRGSAASVQGDLPAALGYLEEAGNLYQKIGVSWPDLATDRSATLLAAGLPGDALAEALTALSSMEQIRGQNGKRAELLYWAARAAVAVADLPTAISRAAQAQRSFRAQGSELWMLRSELVLVQARFTNGQVSAALARRAESIAERSAALDPELAQRAHLLAGRLAIARGRSATARGHLGAAARSRPTASPLSRSLGWLARALLVESERDSRATLSACRAGLAALDEHLRTLGSSELRAHATGHGAELAAIAQRHALASGDARRLLRASERWRAVALATRAAPSAARPELAQPLASLRAVARQLDANRAAGIPTVELERERRRWESAIRSRTLQLSGIGDHRRQRFDPADLRDALGGSRLVELVEVDGVLQVLTVVGGRVRRHQRAGLPIRELEHARFMLRRLALGATPWQSAELVEQIGARLQGALLGPAAADLGDPDDEAEVVVVPPGTLHAVPWSLLPALRRRAVSVAPSASTYLEVSRITPPTRRRVIFVAGPGLSSGAAEIDPIADGYPGATVLRDGTATAERVLAALDGAWLAHVAAHGTFRSDNPLFSALTMDDGPLTVHDFERLRRAPYRLLLPCCDSGVAASVGADELLGLVSSLVPLGSAGILACIVPINDEAAVPLMVAVHAALRSGASLPRALATARQEAGTDPVTLATGHSFIAMGR